MFYIRLFFTAIRSLDSHFLRSLLATVGVLIGVASVVASMSILEGASNRILKNFRSLGSNLLYVIPAQARVSGRVVGQSQSLVPADGDVLLRTYPKEIAAVAPVATGAATVKAFGKSEDYTVIATSEAYFDIQAYEASAGRTISSAEAADAMVRVVVLGSKVAEDLFGGMSPVGEAIQIRSTPYRVIGVMEKRGNIGFLNADEAVYIPIASGLKRFFNRKWLNTLTVSLADDVDPEVCQKQIASALRREHNIRVGQPDDFNIFNQQEALQNINQATMIFGVVFYSIAGISLVVGGIGIMNIMLVSVTERTREIGVRMAVGARRTDILLQFLTEALIISLLGGVFGLLLGWMISDLIARILTGIFYTEITPGIVIIALVTATAVGVVSGFYPAFRASRKDPVEALRYE